MAGNPFHTKSPSRMKLRNIFYNSIVGSLIRDHTQAFDKICEDMLAKMNQRNNSNAPTYMAFTFNCEYYPYSVRNATKQSLRRNSVALDDDLEEEFRGYFKVLATDFYVALAEFKLMLTKAMLKAKSAHELNLVIPEELTNEVFMDMDYPELPNASGITTQDIEDMKKEYPLAQTLSTYKATVKIL